VERENLGFSLSTKSQAAFSANALLAGAMLECFLCYFVGRLPGHGHERTGVFFGRMREASSIVMVFQLPRCRHVLASRLSTHPAQLRMKR
jgi:hypothetical protein